MLTREVKQKFVSVSHYHIISIWFDLVIKVTAKTLLGKHHKLHLMPFLHAFGPFGKRQFTVKRATATILFLYPDKVKKLCFEFLSWWPKAKFPSVLNFDWKAINYRWLTNHYFCIDCNQSIYLVLTTKFWQPLSKFWPWPFK